MREEVKVHLDAVNTFHQIKKRKQTNKKRQKHI